MFHASIHALARVAPSFSLFSKSNVFPFVSSTKKATKNIPNTQVAANITMHPCKSITSNKIGYKATMTKHDALIETVPTVNPNDRTFDGSASTKQINDNGTMPTDETRITKPKLETGTQVNIDVSYPNLSQ